MEPEPNVIRCSAPRKNPRYPKELCGGFVGVFPSHYIVLRPIDHSQHANPASVVVCCRKCHQLYEVARDTVRRVA